MAKAFILMLLGAIIFAAGVWLTMHTGFNWHNIAWALVTGLGGGIFVWGFAIMLDLHSPTSRKY